MSPVWQFREVHVREVDCAEAFDVCPAKRNCVQKDIKNSMNRNPRVGSSHSDNAVWANRTLSVVNDKFFSVADPDLFLIGFYKKSKSV